MEKQTIEIRKIKDGMLLERKDEVALEQYRKTQERLIAGGLPKEEIEEALE